MKRLVCVFTFFQVCICSHPILYIMLLPNMYSINVVYGSYFCFLVCVFSSLKTFWSSLSTSNISHRIVTLYLYSKTPHFFVSFGICKHYRFLKREISTRALWDLRLALTFVASIHLLVRCLQAHEDKIDHTVG